MYFCMYKNMFVFYKGSKPHSFSPLITFYCNIRHCFSTHNTLIINTFLFSLPGIYKKMNF